MRSISSNQSAKISRTRAGAQARRLARSGIRLTKPESELATRIAADVGFAKAPFGSVALFERLLTNAARAGHDGAAYALASRYATGDDGLRFNPRAAIRLYRLLALKRQSESEYNLGVMYFEGAGVARDVKQARYWLRRASSRGDLDAKRLLEQSKICE